MRKRLLAIGVVCCMAAIGFTAASALPASGSTPETAQMHVGFKIGKFVVHHKQLVAHGAVTAVVKTSDGATHSVSKPFTAVVKTKGFRTLAARTCAVLDLQLNKLALSLLGLNVNLGKVVLTISANPRGGVLGSLFCQLAHTKVKLRTLASYARRLTAVTHRSGLSHSGNMLGVSTPFTGQQPAATGAVCPILDLILGPLHLDLLGLIVNLNQVHLSITADPNGGVLGSLFCSLAGSTTTTTTGTT
jgi:hypothetical protein